MTDFTTEELREFLALLPPHNPLLDTLLAEIQRRVQQLPPPHPYTLRPRPTRAALQPRHPRRGAA